MNARQVGRQPVVYRVYDATGRLIYIGASQRLRTRIETHRTQSWWYRLLDRVEVEQHPTMSAAFEAEAAAIRAERPAFNATHTGTYRRGPLTPEDMEVAREWARGECHLLPVPLRWLTNAA